ncbi:unnamed protein product [Prunus brigantina]
MNEVHPNHHPGKLNLSNPNPQFPPPHTLLLLPRCAHHPIPKNSQCTQPLLFLPKFNNFSQSKTNSTIFSQIQHNSRSRRKDPSNKLRVDLVFCSNKLVFFSSSFPWEGSSRLTIRGY